MKHACSSLSTNVAISAWVPEHFEGLYTQTVKFVCFILQNFVLHVSTANAITFGGILFYILEQHCTIPTQ
jgi:hypothetical protein